jgi:nucleotide-binding universal stress UspA family protein
MNSNWPGSVLCPVDFSQPSAVALRFAASFAASTQAGLTLMHAHSWEAPQYFTESQIANLSQQFKDSMQDADQALGEFAARECPGCVAARVVVDSTPVEGILKTARETGADLLVMGTHGRSGFNRFLLGSVAERILRESTIPIATVRSPLGTLAEPRPIQRILCPVNDSPAAQHSLQIAARLASTIHAELTVLHVVEGHESGQRPEICAWLSESDRQGCKVQEVVESGDAADRILNTALKSSADLLVIGAQHRRFADATVMGTTTVRVVRHSPMPVLTIVHPPRPPA